MWIYSCSLPGLPPGAILSRGDLWKPTQKMMLQNKTTIKKPLPKELPNYRQILKVCMQFLSRLFLIQTSSWHGIVNSGWFQIVIAADVTPFRHLPHSCVKFISRPQPRCTHTPQHCDGHILWCHTASKHGSRTPLPSRGCVDMCRHFRCAIYPCFKKRKQNWLVVSTHLKNISQIGSFPQINRDENKQSLKPAPRKDMKRRLLATRTTKVIKAVGGSPTDQSCSCLMFIAQGFLMRVATYLHVVIPIGNDILITGFFHFIKSSFGHMFRTISTGFSMSQSIHVFNICEFSWYM